VGKEQIIAEQPLISIIIPCYNERANLAPMHAEIMRVMRPLEYRYELIFVDDGSDDGSSEELAKLAHADKHLRPVELVRNFGKEIAVTAGLHQATGDAAIILDADMQHPPDLIPEFLDKWTRFAEVVIGVRLPTKGHTSLPKRMASRVFYSILNRITKTPVTPNATDYRLLDRLVIDEFNRFTERNRLTRGLIDWLGFRHAYVYFQPAKRRGGKASYSYGKLIELAITSFVSMSFVPLKLAGYLGFIIVLVSFPMGIFVIFEKYVYSDPLGLSITGTASLGILLVFLVGVILCSIGLMSLYIANIYGEVTGRPLYVMRRPRRRQE
jgi:glycosyltransferase involved in cell wall biosynthesis